MRRRPWPIVLLALFHILAPIWNAIFSARLEGLSLRAYLIESWHMSGWLTLLDVWAILPAAGVAILMMKRWSYPLFLGLMALTIIRNFQMYLMFPQLLHLSVFVGVTAVNVLVVAYFLIPAVRAPYFNPRLRWWETKPRFNVSGQGVVSLLAEGEPEKSACTINNISEGGVFLSTSHRLSVGDEVTVAFEVGGKSVEKTGVVVHIASMQEDAKGCGVRFNLTRESLQDMRDLIKRLREQGVTEVRPPEPWTKDFRDWVVRLVKTGSGLLPEWKNRG